LGGTLSDFCPPIAHNFLPAESFSADHMIAVIRFYDSAGNVIGVREEAH
jgi:hypothetical protein